MRKDSIGLEASSNIKAKCSKNVPKFGSLNQKEFYFERKQKPRIDVKQWKI